MALARWVCWLAVRLGIARSFDNTVLDLKASRLPAADVTLQIPGLGPYEQSENIINA
jgi:hypothetical protein